MHVDTYVVNSLSLPFSPSPFSALLSADPVALWLPFGLSHKWNCLFPYNSPSHQLSFCTGISIFFFFPNGNTWPLVPHHSILIPFPQLHVNNSFVMLSSKFFLNVLTDFAGELRKYEIQFLFCFSLFCSCIINPLSLI